MVAHVRALSVNAKRPAWGGHVKVIIALGMALLTLRGEVGGECYILAGATGKATQFVAWTS